MTTAPNDEMLVAYLDGELAADERDALETAIAEDIAVAARLDELRRSDLPYGQAFELLLEQAPQQKLDAMLTAIASPDTLPQPARTTSRRTLIAAAFGCLVAGVALDRVLLGVQRLAFGNDEEAHWRSEVAEYLALYTADTLRHAPTDDHARSAQLRFAGERLGLDLDPFAMSLGRLEMRRTQILEYDGKPLGQILYLDPEHGPLAFCIMASASGEKPMRSEQRHGLNLVYWSSANHAFVIAARSPFSDLHARAEEIRDELSDRNQA